MKPIKLKMQAFGTYIEPTTIDFEHGLSGEKLFLIHGATGAGKTTILDAICFALYGDKFTGDNQTRNSKMMRSNGISDEKIDTEVEFTFALGEKIFKIVRVLKYFPKRKENKYQIQSELHFNGKLIETKSENVTKKIIELIGFKAEQFRQVVLLPQGEFKKFLFADSDKRQEVLNILFDSAIYKKIEDLLSERAKNSAEEVKKLETSRETLEKQLHGADNESLSEIEAKLSVAQKEYDKFKKISDEAQAEWTEGNLTSAKFAELKQKLTDLEFAKAQLAEIEQIFTADQAEYQFRDAEKSKRAELEEKIRELKEIKATIEDLDKKNTELKNEEKNLSEAAEKVNKYEDNAKKYEARMNQLTNDKARLKLEKIFGEILKLKEDLTATQKKVSIAEKNLESAQIRLTRLQIINNAAHLALTLKEGEPCPVCGSREHPAVIKSAIPTVSELKSAENDVNRLTNEKNRLERDAAKIEGELHAKEKQLEEHADTSELESAKKSFISAEKTDSDLADCEKRINLGNEYVENNKKALEDATKQKSYAENKISRLEGEIQGLSKKIPEIYLNNREKLDEDLSAAEKEFKNLDDAWQKSDKNFREADKNKSAQTEKVKNLQKDCDALQNWLKGKTDPNIGLLEQNAREAREKLNDSIAEKAKLENIRDTLKKFSSELENVKKKLESAQKNADIWRRLSDVANATGKGESGLKISFQRYFLSTMFNDVVVEANNRLKKMSDGRYLFQMKDEGKRKDSKAGLNLEILDDYTGTARPVETLSGGESFLASLSLALGLAAVVQNNAGGIKLDTIFIDEGFGTLDTETLDFAMKTLIELQSGGRLVGIISHVEELKNQISVRLEVTKDRLGSKAEFKS